MGVLYEQRLAALRVEVDGLDPDEEMSEDDYMDARYEMVQEAFPDTVDDARLLLADTPEAWMWSDDGAGTRCVGLGGTVAGFVVDAFRLDAQDRLDARDRADGA